MFGRELPGILPGIRYNVEAVVKGDIWRMSDASSEKLFHVD